MEQIDEVETRRKRLGRNDEAMNDGYIKYVQECNEKVKTTGNTDFKAEPEFMWESKKNWMAGFLLLNKTEVLLSYKKWTPWRNPPKTLIATKKPL